MTVELSVRDVRAALHNVAGSNAAGIGETTTMLLGTIFHQTFADLISTDAERSGLRVVAESLGDEKRRLDQLLAHSWERLLAPRLVRHAASLQTASTQVLMAWKATQNLCRWLDAIVVELFERHPEAKTSWERLEGLLEAEVPLSCELKEEGWTEPVRLVGIADSVLCIPQRSGLCAIELKLGRATPVVDLGQAVLYHLILTRTGRKQKNTALSLLRFSPDLEEQLVESAKLVEAEGRLLDLIGRMAGVIKEEPDPQPPPFGRDPGRDNDPIELVPSRFEELGKRLQREYRNQGVGIELRGTPKVGPRFVRFEVRLTPGGRMDGLKRRTQEVQSRLELSREPMIVQDAGRLYIDLERPDPQTVLFSTIQKQLPTVDPLRGSAKVPLGVDASGNLHFADLASSGRSHILVAGTTGSGKSEWLRMALAGLIATNTPDTLRLITLDPKLAAFNDLERSKFLWKTGSWWIPGGGNAAASELFQDLVEEMDRRYHLIRESGSDNLREHVEKTGRALPRLVCVCDEYYALISQQRQEKTAIEEAVGLLGAKGRAAGVHLILATQQPSRQTISGAIQSNLPCRVALYLQSHIESQMILHQGGAEKLTGSGDLLYKDSGNPVRLQAPYLNAQARIQWLRT
jgi:S-DNA-T family DNA segregation ATPase FtsK/SpoIIIE